MGAEHGFSHSRHADDHGGGTIENPAADQIVQRVYSDNGTLGRGCRLRNVAAQRRLNAAEDLQTGARFDFQRVLAGVVVLTPALDDFKAAMNAAAAGFRAQPDHGIGQKVGGFQSRLRLGVASDLVRE